MSFCQLQLCIAIKIDDILNEFYTFSFQAVIKQFSASGYERSDVMVIDEVEMQRHQQLEKLYRSTRGTKVWMFLLFILLISFVWFCVWRWIDIWYTVFLQYFLDLLMLSFKNVGSDLILFFTVQTSYIC